MLLVVNRALAYHALRYPWGNYKTCIINPASLMLTMSIQDPKEVWLTDKSSFAKKDMAGRVCIH